MPGLAASTIPGMILTPLDAEMCGGRPFSDQVFPLPEESILLNIHCREQQTLVMGQTLTRKRCCSQFESADSSPLETVAGSQPWWEDGPALPFSDRVVFPDASSLELLSCSQTR